MTEVGPRHWISALGTAQPRILSSGACWIAAYLILLAICVLPGRSQGLPPNATKIRVYVLDGGTIVGRNLSRYNLPDEMRDLSVAVFLVVHPKGSLLFDSGLGDRYLNKQQAPPDPAYTVIKTIKSQLSEIGYAPKDITYLALSHMHTDHVGNANDYAGSTWLVQRLEREAMFAATDTPNYQNYAALKDSKTIVLDGDYDVFRDGSVVLISTPGHTPGHQSLFLKFATGDPVILAGDLYHYPEEHSKHRFPNFEPNIEQSALSRGKIETLIEWTNAQLWIAHDILNYRKLKKEPDYYQ